MLRGCESEVAARGEAAEADAGGVDGQGGVGEDGGDEGLNIVDGDGEGVARSEGIGEGDHEEVAVCGGEGRAEGVVDDGRAEREAAAVDVDVGWEFSVAAAGGFGGVAWWEEDADFEVGSDVVEGFEGWLVLGGEVVV